MLDVEFLGSVDLSSGEEAGLNRTVKFSIDVAPLPSALLAELKALASKRDVPYQSLLKVFLADRVSRETRTGDALPTRALHPTGRATRKSRSRKSSRAARG